MSECDSERSRDQCGPHRAVCRPGVAADIVGHGTESTAVQREELQVELRTRPAGSRKTSGHLKSPER